MARALQFFYHDLIFIFISYMMLRGDKVITYLKLRSNILLFDGGHP